MKQLLLTLLCLLAVTAGVKAEERSWDFKTTQTVPKCDNGATTNLKNADNNSVGTWDFTCTTTSAQGDKTNGPRYGASSSPVNKGATLVLKDSDIPANATINEVTFTVKGNAKASGSKWNLKVGNRGGRNTTLEFSGNSTQSKSWTNVNLVGNDIVIELAENATGGGFHLQGVKITYTTSTGPIQCDAPTFSVNGSALSDGDNVYPDDVIKAACTTPGSTVKLFVHEVTIGDEYSVSESDLDSSLILKATASVVGNENYTDSEATITVNVVEKPGPVYPTECAAPTFNVEDGANLYPGDVIKAACETPESTVVLTINGTPVSGDTYTVTDSDINKELVVKATASVEGKDGPITNEKSIKVNVIEKPVVLTDELTPTVISISGSTYKLYEYKSTATKVEYYAKVALENDAFHINSTASTGGAKSGIVSKANVNNLIIDNIVVTVPDGTPVMKMSNSPGTKTGVIGGTAKTVEVNAAEDAVEITGTSKKEGSNTVYTYTPSNDYKYFALTTSKNSHFSSVVINYKKPAIPAPEPTEVTVAFTGNADEYTVGQEGVSVGYTVTPAEAAQYVNFISSDTEAVTVAKNAGNNALGLTFNQAAENVTVTASLADGHESEYTLSPASFTFNVIAGQIEIKEPGQVKSDPIPDDENNSFLLERGDRITFYSTDAAKLRFKLTYKASEGETPYQLSFDETAPYTYTATENIEEIIVTPLDAAGTAYDDKSFKGKIEVISNPISETTVTFDYTKSSLIDESYSLKTGNDYTTVWTFNSPELRLFDASCYIQEGESSSFTYLENQGWKFNVDETNGNSYYLYLNSSEVDGTTYTIKKVVFRGDFEGNEYIEFSLPENSNGTMNANIWTGESTYLTFDITALEQFILSGIDVTYAHDEIESPYIFEKDGKVAISHSKTDHKIFYRIVNKKANAANHAPSAGETYNEYTTPLTVKSGDIVYAYAQHPHGMMSDNAVFDVDTYILTGVDGIEDAVEEDVEWFTLDGIRVAEPVKGMYIRIRNGKAEKIML